MAQFNFFLVDPEEQSRSAKEIAENLEKIRESNQIIFTKLLPNLNNYWTGEAKNAVVIRYTELQEVLVQLIRSYEALQTDLMKVSENYSRADQEAITYARSFKA
jgi:WXG100 family type VII secretion target